MIFHVIVRCSGVDRGRREHKGLVLKQTGLSMYTSECSERDKGGKGQKHVKTWTRSTVPSPPLDAETCESLHSEWTVVWTGLRTIRKGTNVVSTNGVTANFVFFYGGTFWVLPSIFFYLPKSARAYLSPQSAKIHYLCSGPMSVDPICPQPNVCAYIYTSLSLPIYLSFYLSIYT